MSLDRLAVEQTLGVILRRVPDADLRLVGTASSVLRGINLPASDVDVLFRDRAGLDAWFGILSADLEVVDPPEWIAEACQYFARLQAGGVAIELSTLEIESDNDALECIGAGPWLYFDLVPCGDATIPAVATELRLITEFTRGREDRYRPIIQHLRVVECDVALVRRGLTSLGVPPGDVDRVAADLRPPAREYLSQQPAGPPRTGLRG